MFRKIKEQVGILTLAGLTALLLNATNVSEVGFSVSFTNALYAARSTVPLVTGNVTNVDEPTLNVFAIRIMIFNRCTDARSVMRNRISYHEDWASRLARLGNSV